MSPKLDRGLVEVYTGNAKGKTSAALGLALRAIGRGFKVCFVCFFKKNVSSVWIPCMGDILSVV